MDDHLKKLMQELGVAINEALSDSSEINGAIQNVRDAGFDILLVLEATIGLNRRSSVRGGNESTGVLGEDIELKISPQDVKFLKSLKIKVDDLDAQS